MRPLLLALAALLLVLAPADARRRCGPGERALKNGVCATLRPHSPVPAAPRRTCAGGACDRAPLTPSSPLVSRPLQVPPPNVPNLAPPPLIYTPGAGLHYQ